MKPWHQCGHLVRVTGSVDDESLTPLMHSPDNSRERLATILTSPQNTRFAQVIVNRM